MNGRLLSRQLQSTGLCHRSEVASDANGCSDDVLPGIARERRTVVRVRRPDQGLHCRKRRSRTLPLWPLGVALLIATVAGLMWMVLGRLSRSSPQALAGYIDEDG